MSGGIRNINGNAEQIGDVIVSSSGFGSEDK
jgi:hypothetical protein